MIQGFLLLGTLFADLSLASGAFASHALKAQLTEKALAIFETGTCYQRKSHFSFTLPCLSLRWIRPLALTTESPILTKYF